jgi:hypothetical protein
MLHGSVGMDHLCLISMDFKPDIVVLTSGCICTKSDPTADGARSFKPRNGIAKMAKLEKIDDSYSVTCMAKTPGNVYKYKKC